METGISKAPKENLNGPTANASTQTAAVESKPALELDPQPKAPDSCSNAFDEVKTPCSTSYGEVIYATKEKMFYLLPERAASSIKEAMNELEQHISVSKSPEERLKGMNTAGLLEYFLEPKLTNFLQGEQKSRMLEIEAQEPDIAQPTMAMRLKAVSREARNSAALDKQPDQSEYARNRELANQQQASLLEANSDGQKLQQLYSEWKKLKNIAVAQAKVAGYTYESGNLFSPGALEARSRVQTYLKARSALTSSGKLTTLKEEDFQKNKKAYLDATNCVIDGKARMCGYLKEVANERKKVEKDFAAYIDSILKVADYGLALPEFALIPDTGDISAGIEKFKAYLEMEQQQIKLTEQIRSKYKAWIDASGQNVAAPTGIVEAEQAEWQRIQQARLKLREDAEAAVAAALPLRHLLWEPEQFQPKPEERLVKAGFPLREVALFNSPNSPVKHLSLLNLEGITKVLKKDASEIGAAASKDLQKLPGNSNGKAESDSDDNPFHEWLREQGALAIKDQQSDWFDEKGWFDVEMFHSYLKSKNYKVETFEDAGARKDWGLRLRQLLFKEEVRSSLRLFDNSPQAQLVRCLTPPQSSIHTATKVSGPSFSVADNFKASAKAEASLGIDLARGEVELMKMDLPGRDQAKDILVPYLDYEKNRKNLNLGRFSIHLGARAWGYTGATLLLSSSVQLGRANVQGGLNLPEITDAKRADTTNATAATARSEPVLEGDAAKVRVEDGAKAQFNLFAGVQAGILLTGALNWAPPKDIAALRAAPTPGMSNSVNSTKASQWSSLARLTAGFTAAYGLGANADIGISLHEGRFIMRFKASLIVGTGAGGEFQFEVGYDGVTDLINLLRREMHKNQDKSLIFVTDDAADYIDKLNFLGAAGMEVAMSYMQGVDMVMSLYEALTGGGRGASIAHTIMTYRNQVELEQWILSATPGALGPMLMTLTSEAKAFNADEYRGEGGNIRPAEKKFSKDECHLLQQQAVERILGLIVKQAKTQGTITLAQAQFEEACMSMNRFGTKSEKNAEQTYCENRLRMDNFMSEAAQRLHDSLSDEMRARYKSHVKLLGARLDGSCHRIQYYGKTFVPGGKATYIGAKP
ncbi:UNVERIFIED_ORG: hypothetical protein J2X80_001200 [Pseudomonas fluorescens]|nr:hypothetical protein [Pseudomonas fluorescens]